MHIKIFWGRLSPYIMELLYWHMRCVALAPYCVPVWGFTVMVPLCCFLDMNHYWWRKTVFNGECLAFSSWAHSCCVCKGYKQNCVFLLNTVVDFLMWTFGTTSQLELFNESPRDSSNTKVVMISPLADWAANEMAAQKSTTPIFYY